MLNILIADDHAIIRKGLIDIISEERDMRVIQEAKNADEVLQSLRNKELNFLILDINMPGKCGLEIIDYIKTIRPDVPILMLSINPEEQFAKRCIRMGASGYLNKDIETEELILAILLAHIK